MDKRRLSGCCGRRRPGGKQAGWGGEKPESVSIVLNMVKSKRELCQHPDAAIQSTSLQRNSAKDKGEAPLRSPFLTGFYFLDPEIFNTGTFFTSTPCKPSHRTASFIFTHKGLTPYPLAADCNVIAIKSPLSITISNKKGLELDPCGIPTSDLEVFCCNLTHFVKMSSTRST